MDKVEIFENERATGYNAFVEMWIPGYRYFLDQLPALLRETRDKNLLVVGCGTGNEIERFVTAPDPWRITGIDPSPQMIEQAREKLRQYDHVQLVEGIITDLEAGKRFGAATLILVLHFLDDNSKLNLLTRIAERLVRGAMLVILDITGDKRQIGENLQVLRLLLPAGLDKEQLEHRLNRIQHELYPVSEERLAALCTAAGFEPPLRFFQSAIYMGWLMKKK